MTAAYQTLAAMTAASAMHQFGEGRWIWGIVLIGMTFGLFLVGSFYSGGRG